MRAVVIAVAVAVAVVLGGCASVTEGTVTGKTFEAAHYEDRERSVYATHCGYKYRYTADGYKFAYGCDYEFDHYDTYQVWVEECYRLRFEDADKHKHKGTTCVSRWVYAEKTIGSYYQPGE